MSKQYNNDLGSLRLIKKQGHYSDAYRGWHMDDIVSNMPEPHKCWRCGFYMVPYKDTGNAIIWHCTQPNCINNPDSKFKWDATTENIRSLGNDSKVWNDFNPRKIA